MSNLYTSREIKLAMKAVSRGEATPSQRTVVDSLDDKTFSDYFSEIDREFSEEFGLDDDDNFSVEDYYTGEIDLGLPDNYDDEDIADRLSPETEVSKPDKGLGVGLTMDSALKPDSEVGNPIPKMGGLISLKERSKSSITSDFDSWFERHKGTYVDKREALLDYLDVCVIDPLVSHIETEESEERKGLITKGITSIAEDLGIKPKRSLVLERPIPKFVTSVREQFSKNSNYSYFEVPEGYHKL